MSEINLHLPIVNDQVDLSNIKVVPLPPLPHYQTRQETAIMEKLWSVEKDNKLYEVKKQ